MPDQIEDDDDEGGSDGQGVIQPLATELAFAPHMRFKVRFVGDKRLRALFEHRADAESFVVRSEAADPSTFDQGSAAELLGGMILLLVASMQGGIRIWMRLPEGAFLVFRNGLWQPPEHLSFKVASDAAASLEVAYR